jgi:hypothetical protein
MHLLTYVLVSTLSACIPCCHQHDYYGKADDSYGKKDDKQNGKHKPSFYDPPEFYMGKYGMGHFGEDKNSHSSKKGYSAELQSEAAIYNDEGYDRFVVKVL